MALVAAVLADRSSDHVMLEYARNPVALETLP